jgi:hypothetical protein
MSDNNKWKQKDIPESHLPRHRRDLENPEVFFTLKAYSQLTEKGHRSLKFTVDFNAPFEANVNSLEPYYISVHNKHNRELFQEILDHVNEVYKYVSDPVNYSPANGQKYPITEKRSDDVDRDRGAQQHALAEILRLTKGRINHFFYEQGSNNRVGVSAVALSDGDGDPRPPKK